MNVLAIDTSTERASVAVMRGAARWESEAPGGAAASATVLPAVLRILEQAGLRPAALDAIAFGRGPGSFTGLRTACSVAQGLAFGAGVPLLPVDTLMTLAEIARGTVGATRVTALLDARMGEVYFAHYEWREGVWERDGEPGLAAPERIPLRSGWTLAGDVFDAMGADFLPGAVRVPAHPHATALLDLAPAWTERHGTVPADAALPLYVRDKVARTTAERAAAAATA